MLSRSSAAMFGDVGGVFAQGSVAPPRALHLLAEGLILPAPNTKKSEEAMAAGPSSSYLTKSIGCTSHFPELTLLSRVRVLPARPPAAAGSPQLPPTSCGHPVPSPVPPRCDSSATLLLPKQSSCEGARSPRVPPGEEVPSSSPRPRSAGKGQRAEGEKEQRSSGSFTRMAVVPRCPNPCPGRAYPRTSLLFRANQTGPGYTLTRPPSRDKAARGSPGTRGSSQLLTCSHAKPNSSRARRAPHCRALLQQEEQQGQLGVTAQPSSVLSPGGARWLRAS